MQVFTPYPEPIKVAQCLDAKRLNKQVIECHQILAAIDGTGKGWFNHPVVKMYKPYREWLECYLYCFEAYRDYLNADYETTRKLICKHDAEYYSNKANSVRVPFLTEDFCDQHKRRLYAKNPEHYKQFAEYGMSEENWYYDNETKQIVKYINGKKVL